MEQEVSTMLLQFRVKNYRSIGNEIIVDLVAGKGRENPHFLITQNNIKILPVVSFYGANASGKSNIVSAICKMFENIADSARKGGSDTSLTIPFLFNNALSNEPTEMEMFIALGDHEWQYGYSVSRTEVHEEWLYYRKLSKNKTKTYIVFEREGDEINFSNEYEKFAVYKNFITNNFLAISFLGNLENKNPSEAMHIFNNIVFWAKNNWICSNPDVIASKAMKIVLETFKISKDSILEFVQEFDPCIEDIKIEDETNEIGETHCKVFTKHNGKWYPLEIESTGTKKLVEFYLSLFISLHKTQTTLVFDELDTYLHPLIIRRIIAIFHNKEINKMNSQLITTSHNLIIMDKNELRRDQIWFVEKECNGFTEAYSLASFKSTRDEIRSDLSYGKHYLSGRFGAIPYAER